MRKKQEASPEESELRRSAEAQVGDPRTQSGTFRSDAETRRLLHELEVHEIELKMQNEELRAARVEVEAGLARYTSLFDFAPIGYATLGLDGTVREINHAGAHLLRKERSRIVGARFDSFVRVDDRLAFEGLLLRARSGEQKETAEVHLTPRPPAQGPAVPVRVTAAAVLAGQPSVLLAFEDVTELRAREQRLVRSDAALREANRRKDEFLAVLSHELRNPLAPIRTSLYVLAQSPPGSEGAQGALAVIDRQVSHLAHLVEDLLDVTRISRGKVHLQRVRLELGDLVRRTIEDLHSSFQSRGILLTSGFDAGRFWVDADPARITQAVTNLLGNAEKFTPSGGSVRVSLRREDAMVVLRVRDTGAGIAPEVLPRVFEAFAQAPQTMDRARGGLGLGLAMAKGLIELHGGTISVASGGPGRGTEVTVALRLDGPAEPERAPPPAVQSATRRVLVIEDNADAADMLKAALSLRGHDVQIAQDGRAGLALARTFRPDVVICDLGLPEMDGYAVARELRSDADDGLRNVYLVALSGYANPEDSHRARAAGFDRHVAKPASLEDLERVFAEAPPPGPYNQPSRSPARTTSR